jgi:hypothetical protein
MAGRIAPRWTTERGMALNHTQRRAKDSLVCGWRMAHEQKEDIFSGALGNFTTIFHTHLYFPFLFRLFFSTGKFYSTAMFLTISHIPSSRRDAQGIYLHHRLSVRIDATITIFMPPFQVHHTYFLRTGTGIIVVTSLRYFYLHPIPVVSLRLRRTERSEYVKTGSLLLERHRV